MLSKKSSLRKEAASKLSRPILAPSQPVTFHSWSLHSNKLLASVTKDRAYTKCWQKQSPGQESWMEWGGEKNLFILTLDRYREINYILPFLKAESNVIYSPVLSITQSGECFRKCAWGVSQQFMAHLTLVWNTAFWFVKFKKRKGRKKVLIR